MKLEEYANNSKVWLWGKVFILNSEQFGKHIFLVSKFPGKTYQEKTKFIDLKSCEASTIYYSSVMNDEVLEVFDSLTEYIKWEYN